MGNIMINDVCNLMCSYCFANEYVNGDSSTDITYGNFKKAVDWINKSGDLKGSPIRVGFIGGEPLLHHDLESLIEYAVLERRPGQELLVFSNCLLLDKYIDLFARNDISVLCNLNSPEDIGQKRYEKIINNLALARKKAVNVSLGVNYYKPDLSMDFALDVIKEFAYKNIRIGLVCPNTSEKVGEGPFNYMSEMKQPLIEFAEKAARLGCGMHLDCQKFPSCIMAEESDRIDEIARRNRVEIELTTHAKCTPVIDILPNLQIVRCFGVSKEKYAVPMNSFETVNDACGYFETYIDGLGLMLAAGESCKQCYHKLTGKCQGGCISYKLGQIDEHTRLE